MKRILLLDADVDAKQPLCYNSTAMGISLAVGQDNEIDPADHTDGPRYYIQYACHNRFPREFHGIIFSAKSNFWNE